MRDEEGRDGQCPVADLAPVLNEDNEVVLDLYNQLKGSATQVTAKDKTYQYLLATEATAIFEINDIDPADREETWRRLLILEEVANDRRPTRSKGKR